jgi:hypothetical protein
MKRKILLAIVFATFMRTVHGEAPVLTRAAITPAVEQYLREKGDFCLGKFDWPIVVTDHDVATKSSNAVQMPVLEKLGLVVSSKSPTDAMATAYALTEKGKKFYLARKSVTLGPLDRPIDHAGDLCVAKLGLDRVVGWEPVEIVKGHAQTTVKYTYKVTSAAEWVRDPQIKVVFPMVSRIMGGGKMQLMQRLTWTQNAWTAVATGG